MALDGIVIANMVQELQDKLTDEALGKIVDKINAAIDNVGIENQNEPRKHLV